MEIAVPFIALDSAMRPSIEVPAAPESLMPPNVKLVERLDLVPLTDAVPIAAPSK